MTALYRLATGGVVRTADGAFIPNNANNRDWATYTAWLAVPNTPDAAPALSLSDYKTLAKVGVEQTAEVHRQALAARAPGRVMLDDMRYAECILCVADGSPNSTKYPILGAEATAKSITIALTGTAAKAELDTLKAALAAIETAKYTGDVAIDAAGSTAAVDTAVAAISWP